MAAQRGRDLLLKIKRDGAFVTVAGLRTKALRFNARTVDVTDSGSAQAWRELLPGAGMKSVEVSGAGVFRDAGSDATLRSAFFDGFALDAQLVIPDFGTVAGPFLISALTYAGTYAGEATFELTLASAGRPVFTAHTTSLPDVTP